MRITAEGQVTIPADIRERAGLFPNTEVDFEFDGEAVRIKPAPQPSCAGRGGEIVALLRGSAGPGMTTDEIMALTRGE